MRGFKNNQGTFFHCSEIGERNWVLRLVGSGDIGPTARNFTKNPSQRLDTGIIPTPWWFTPECEQQLLSIGEDGKIPSSIKPDSAIPDSTIAELTEEQLRHRLKMQLEYYFSRENLNQDRYLRSQMDNDQYVPISIVASFPKISHLTPDQDLIISVLKESINVQVDESNTKVRAAHRRCTLLLREIPEFTDEREVKAMFIGCPPYTSLKYGLNNSWYVTFETEEATQLAFLHLQNLRKSFNGKQICVRIKTGTAPLPDPSATNGRNSPAKSDIFVGIGNGISTIATSKGYITGFPAASTFTINPNCTTRLTTETELNLDQLMGTFGYTIRAIFQPKESEPPKNEQPSENVPLLPPDEKKAKRESPTGTLKTCNILGPPSTEIVGSMLSAAAEANETKKREREVQKQQWQQIMDNLAPMPSIMGGQRITDSLPFIKKPPPILSRFISQESADIEVALDIQRAARKKQETEAKAKAQQQAQQQQQQQQQQIQQQKKIQQHQQVQQQQQQQPQIQQVHVQQHHQTYSQPQHQQPHYHQPQQSHQSQQQQHQHQHYNNNDGGGGGYRQNNSNRNYSDRSKDYNGYSSGERSNYDKSDRRSNQPYRGGRSYDSRSDRSGKSDSYSNKSDYSNKNENYHKNESYNKTEGYNNKNDNYINKNESYYKPRGERNNYNSNTTSTASNNYYYDRSSTSNYSNQQQRYEKPRYQSDRKPAASRNYQHQQQQNVPFIQTTRYPSTPSITVATTSTTSESKVRTISNPEPPPKIITTTSTTKTPPITPSSSSTVPPATTKNQQKIIPVVIVPPPSTSSTTTTTTIVHSDAASTTSLSTRKKDNSESSEYNFVDGDFPSLVEKQKVKEKEKEKAKFSAVVAGKKNDVKKSYAQTLKRQESKQSS